MLANPASPTTSRSAATRTAAVIDVGTTSIRMAIADIEDGGDVRLLTSLSQAVALGKDTFTRCSIEKSTIEECVRVLKSYKRVLAEYGLDRPEQMRAVATSAVREALNNVVKHAAATEVWLRVLANQDAVTVAIEDNGKGISTLPSSRDEGLRSLHDRMARVGGNCVIESGPNSGTIVRLSVPVPQPH